MTDRIEMTPVIAKAGDDGIDRVVHFEGLTFAADLRLVITGADQPYSRGWWETAPAIFVEEVVYPDGSIDRWENGLPVLPRASA